MRPDTITASLLDQYAPGMPDDELDDALHRRLTRRERPSATKLVGSKVHASLSKLSYHGGQLGPIAVTSGQIAMLDSYVGLPELTGHRMHGSVALKGRIDLLRADGRLIDFKTCATPDDSRADANQMLAYRHIWHSPLSVVLLVIDYEDERLLSIEETAARPADLSPAEIKTLTLAVHAVHASLTRLVADGRLQLDQGRFRAPKRRKRR